MLAVADRRQLAQLARRQEQGDTWVPEPERSEPSQLGAQVERELSARDDRVHLRDGSQVVLGQLCVGMSRKGVREGLDALRPDREAGCRSMAPEALQMLGASREAPVQVKGSRRPARPLPLLACPCDQDDGAVEALDEARGDDPDHAFVPALVRKHVTAAAPFRLRPVRDLRERLAEDLASTPCRSRFSPLELVRQAAGLVGVLGEQELERRARSGETPRAR